MVERAKGLLQSGLGLTEPEAFRWIQKTAMDLRKSMREVAEGVIEHGVGCQEKVATYSHLCASQSCNELATRPRNLTSLTQHRAYCAHARGIVRPTTVGVRPRARSNLRRRRTCESIGS